MATSTYIPLNTIDIGINAFLRVRARHGAAIHLASAIGAAGRSAVEPWRVCAANDLDDYDDASLCCPLWSPRTLCGMAWSRMASHVCEVDLLAGSGEGERYVCAACEWIAFGGDIEAASA